MWEYVYILHRGVAYSPCLLWDTTCCCCRVTSSYLMPTKILTQWRNSPLLTKLDPYEARTTVHRLYTWHVHLEPVLLLKRPASKDGRTRALYFDLPIDYADKALFTPHPLAKHWIEPWLLSWAWSSSLLFYPSPSLLLLRTVTSARKKSVNLAGTWWIANIS